MEGKKYLYREYRKGKRRLPSDLRFLKEMHYDVYAFIKYEKDDEDTFRVELRANRLKKLLTKVERLEQLLEQSKAKKESLIDKFKEDKKQFRKEKAQLLEEQSRLRTTIKELEKQVINLKTNYENSQRELGKICKERQEVLDKASRGEKSPKSYLQKIQEDKLIEERKQVQGGLAGL